MAPFRLTDCVTMRFLFKRDLCGRGCSDMHSAEAPQEPEHDDDDQHQAKNAAQAAMAIPVVAVIAAKATEQQDHQDDNEDRAHQASCTWNACMNARPQRIRWLRTHLGRDLLSAGTTPGV